MVLRKYMLQHEVLRSHKLSKITITKRNMEVEEAFNAFSWPNRNRSDDSEIQMAVMLRAISYLSFFFFFFSNLHTVGVRVAFNYFVVRPMK